MDPKIAAQCWRYDVGREHRSLAGRHVTGVSMVVLKSTVTGRLIERCGKGAQ